MRTDTLRILVTATRDLTDAVLVQSTLDKRLTRAINEGKTLVIVQGGAAGGDKLARDWGHAMQSCALPVVVETHPARNHPSEDFGPWPECGPKRNAYMVRLGAAECLAFIGPCASDRCWRSDPHGSHGASGCANLAESAGIPTVRWLLWKK